VKLQTKYLLVMAVVMPLVTVYALFQGNQRGAAGLVLGELWALSVVRRQRAELHDVAERGRNNFLEEEVH
jgi:hypothetical protein